MHMCMHTFAKMLYVCDRCMHFKYIKFSYTFLLNTKHSLCLINTSLILLKTLLSGIPEEEKVYEKHFTIFRCLLSCKYRLSPGTLTRAYISVSGNCFFCPSCRNWGGPSVQSCDQGSWEEGGALPCRAAVCLLESQVFSSSGSPVWLGQSYRNLQETSIMIPNEY